VAFVLIPPRSDAVTGWGLATRWFWPHRDLSNNYCSAMNCQSRRSSCLCKSFRFA